MALFDCGKGTDMIPSLPCRFLGNTNVEFGQDEAHEIGQAARHTCVAHSIGSNLFEINHVGSWIVVHKGYRPSDFASF